MATLTITNVPAAMLAALADRAARSKRTVEEEVLSMIEDSVLARPGNDDTGPLDFPRILNGSEMTVKVRVAGERLPVPLATEDNLPE
jgi:hypothetical protein